VPTKLLIFDLDGTLIDSSADISKALNYAFQPYGTPEVGLAETIALIGEGLTRLIGKVIEEKAPGLDQSLVLKRFLEYYTRHLADNTRPYPGVERVLEGLSRYGKAVVSNKLEALTIKVLEAVHLLSYFEYIVGADTAAEKKPSPLPILTVLAHFEVRPDEALLIGDSIYDIEAGFAAGVRTVAAMYGYGDPDFSKKADYRIDSLEGLFEILARQD